MFRKNTIILSLGLILWACSVWARPESDSLEKLKSSQVLFIGGLYGEIVPGYFRESLDALQSNGIMADAFYPKSSFTPLENTELIKEELLRRYGLGLGGPIVAVGHSKGGLELLLTVLLHPELVREGVVDRVVLVQPALTGHPLADKVMDIADGLPRIISSPLRFFSGQVNRILGTNNRVARSMHSRELKPLIHALISRLSPKDRAVISEKLYIFIGKVNPSFPFSTIQILNGEEGDGLIPVSAQIVDPDFGHQFLVSSDHITSFTNITMTRAGRMFIRSLTMDIISLLYSSWQTDGVNSRLIVPKSASFFLRALCGDAMSIIKE